MRIEPSELAGGGKGLVEYGTQINFPNPWPGGTWRLRDIMDYERIASDALLETCAEHREDFLREHARAGPRRDRRARRRRRPTGSPPAQRDPAGAARLAALLVEHGVEVKAAANGDVWVPLAQPYGRFVERDARAAALPRGEARPRQGHRAARTTSPPGRLPLMMGVTVEKATLPGRPRAVAAAGAAAAARTAPPSPSSRAAPSAARS